MKHTLKIANIALILLTSVASASDPFDELDAEMDVYESQRTTSEETKSEFEQYLKTQKSDYQIWQEQYLKEFDQFQQQVVNKWGKAEPIKAQYDVEFNVNKEVKSVVDFDAGEVKVELIVDKNLSPAQAEIAVKEQFEKLLTDKNSNIGKVFNDIEVVDKGEITLSKVEFSEGNKQQSKDIIIKQTQSQAQEIDKKTDRALLTDSSLTEEEATLLAIEQKTALLKTSQARLLNSEKGYQTAQNSASDETKIVTYKVKLPNNSLQNRARLYVPFAEKESVLNNIPAPLIMAIMHSESAFNPKAKSAVPAYGLMQIVPRTAGHDVNKLVRNIDKPMQVSDLYVPEINVETGSAYLNILDKRYLKAIKNDQSRLYCTIASYNTGAGNVARVFNKNGSRNINKAATVINQLTPEQVYQQLMLKLPYDETKHYLERVYSRIDLYQTKI